MQDYTIDATDKRILELLQTDGKMKIKEIANVLGMTNTPIFDRIKRLEKHGFIKGYTALLDYEKLGVRLIAFCSVTLEKHHAEYIDRFVKEVLQIEEVIECYHIAGLFDYLLKIQVEDMTAYQYFMTKKLAALSNVSRVQSSFVMTQVKKEWSIPF